MLVTALPSAFLDENCYVVAPGAGEECVVVDPGLGIVEELDTVVAQHKLRPVAVLLTHGHLDHTFCVTPVCGARGIPAYIHPEDRELLADPAKAISTDPAALFGGQFAWSEPDDVQPLADGTVLRLAGMDIAVDHTPGHTRGSVMFRPALPASEAAPPLCFTGDVLFAGSIGRTDLRGGDTGEMITSLRTKVLTLDDATIVLPGHGPQTTIGRERATNPFLVGLSEESLPS